MSEEREPFARTTDELLAQIEFEKPIPKKEHRDALKRAGVRPDLLKLVPDVFVFTLGVRLLQMENRAMSLAQQLTLRAEANTQRSEPWQVTGAEEFRLATEVQIARQQLVGARYGVEAALGVLEYLREQGMTEYPVPEEKR